MKQNEDQSKTTLIEKDNIDMLYNKSEAYQIMRNAKSEGEEKTKKSIESYNDIKDNNNDDTPSPRVKRSNSIKLYKRHKKEKELRNSIKKENNINIDNNKDNIYEGPVVDVVDEPINNNNIDKKKNKSKRVTFVEPNFVSIIDVESYKKFNAENTCKDPFDEMQYMQNINNVNNINNYNINININNNKKKQEQEQEGKEKINCSCACIVF